MRETPSEDLSVAGHIVDVLVRRGVKRLFGIPGGGSSLALIEAADRAGLAFILTRTETAGAIMAAVTGELSETPGVMLAGVGPGAASAVNGVAYAHLERAPMMLFTDGPASSLHQAFDQKALYAPISKAQSRLTGENVVVHLDDLIDTALAHPRGPVQIDLTALDAERPLEQGDHSKPPRPVARDQDLPEDKDVELARQMIAQSRRPVIIAGLEARWGNAPQALTGLATALGCPVLSSYKAKGTVPDDHTLAAGLFTGAQAEAPLLESADLVIFAGFDPVEMIPSPWSYEASVIDLRADRGPDLPVENALSLNGGLEDSVATLLPQLSHSTWTDQEIAIIRDRMTERTALAGSGHTAQSVVEELDRQAPSNCRMTVDAGAHMFSAMTRWKASVPFGVLKSNGLSTMGYALPAAIAAALHEPDVPVVAVTGDGGMGMCLGELATAAEHSCRIVVVVLNDSSLSLIDIKQVRTQRLCRGVHTSDIDFAQAAGAFGCKAWRVGRHDDIAPVIRNAFSTEGPVLIDVSVDASGYGDQLSALRG